MTLSTKELAFIKALCERELTMIGGDRESAKQLLEKINNELRGQIRIPASTAKWSAYDVA